MNSNEKLIFMGTPEFAVPTLDALIKAKFDVVAVYTQPPRPAGRGQKETPSLVHQYAAAHNIPVYTPVSLKDERTQELFRSHNADVAVVAAYGLLLPKNILEATPFGCINVHPSLLPRWRGAAPIQRAVMAGDKETGIVIMQMNTGLDTGDMLFTKHVPIPDGMTAGELHDTLANLAGPMVIEVLNNFNKLPLVKQSEAGVTYANKITKEECRINWNESTQAIRNKILGLSPYPGAFFTYKNENIKVLNAKCMKLEKKLKTGSVIDDNFTIACGEDALTDMVLQRPGKNPMSAQEMLRGYPIPKGELLE